MSENTIPQGRPIWIDLTTTDIEKARAFYGTVFGWTFEDQGPDFGNYNMVKSGDAFIGGMMGRVPEMPAGPDVWTVYLNTPDAQATCDKATEHGGSVMVPPMQVGGSGTMGVIIDSGNCATGFWQPGDFEGTQKTAVAGTPCWFEIFTPAYATSLDFYRDVFGWDIVPMSDTDEFRYSTNGPDRAAVAGIMEATFLGEGHPGFWRTYLGAVDVDATAATIVEAGGSVVEAPQDSPYGRFATVADDQGANFLIVQAPPA
ncbi:VOC family protein [Raineyella sp. W15-4]|uniref:VOC family protein n=1 Tax=Raineyella sp. W15-4 TaxID=3081651 RepID=UPI0029549AEB|nr:VOC family protein [Raineyella sp. W15-4]WOQ18232.1 VOC family protein [Raineyella sp. W15-4]